jgi:hypothetical protein
VLLTALNESVDDSLGRYRTIREYKVFMLYSIICKGALVILGIVEADDLRDLQVLKYAHIA